MRYTSTNFRKEWRQLQRAKQTDFPEIAKVFSSGDSKAQYKILEDYVKNGNNLEKTEATFRAIRMKEQFLHTGRCQMTLQQMREAKFSE